jgi:hypothetical protein
MPIFDFRSSFNLKERQEKIRNGHKEIIRNENKIKNKIF